MPEQIAYGPGAEQFGELYRPATVRHPGVIVIVHGGFWRARYDLSLGRPLAADLAAAGFTAWNVEYRRVGTGGGWPATLDDVAAAVDHLADLDVDASRVVAVGHSAGGQLAVWAAGRRDARVPLTAAVSQAGVLDLTVAARTGVGQTAVPDLLGGT
ncbi:MAG TPA: alpha/beta hydrolase, partial [Jatrophihabitans sp.]|nr:alpha/beta hydrolase [Jatrophihabitans sp.]